MDKDDEDELKKPVKEVLINKHEESTTAFDAIENEFNTVMNGLGGDTKLLPFRLQYEKLFRALKKSIQHEKFLAEKCTELSSEVTQNASKVRDALKLSQQDQNAIVMLKQDTERAWALVEQGKKKEQIIFETVDSLQDETNKLSWQLQEERTRALRQEEDMVQITKDRDNLKSQRDDYLHQIDQSKTREKDMTLQVHTSEGGTKELKDKNLSLSKELKECTDELETSKKRQEDSDLEAVSLKSKLKQKTQDYIDLQYSASLAKDNSEQLNKKLKEANKKMEEQASECETLSQQTERLREMLEVQRNKMASINEGFKKNGEELKLAIATQHRITSEKSQLQRKYDSEHRNALRLQQEVGDSKAASHITKKEIQSLQQELDESNQREDQTSRQLTVLKREKDLLHDKIHRYEKISKGSEESIAHQNQSIIVFEKDLSKARDTINSLNKKLNSLDKLSEKHNNDLSQERMDSEKIKDAVRLKDIELQEMKKELSRWQLKSSDEIQMCSQLRVDRGKASRQLIGAQEEIKTLIDQENVFSNEVKSLRQELLSKDELLVKERFETKQEKTKKEQASSELSRMKRHLDDQEGAIEQQDLVMRRLNSSLKQMDDDALYQRKEYDQIVNERDVLGAQLIRRNDELALIQERMKMQGTTLKKGEIQYQERIDEIRLLKNALQDSRRELSAKHGGSGDDDRLSRELSQKEKELLQEKVKVKALSEELENPLNVHRWRKLEGSDPTAFELMQKIELLQRRLIKKSEQVIEKDAIIKEDDKQYCILKKQLERQPGSEVVEKLSMRETEVREKERQMRAMAGELNMNQTQVSEYKKEINRLHHDLHELKDKFFELKKKEATMKERELQWLAESGMMELDRVYHEEARMVQTMTPHRRAMQKPIRYVGGGFRAIPHLDTPSKDEDVNVFR